MHNLLSNALKWLNCWKDSAKSQSRVLLISQRVTPAFLSETQFLIPTFTFLTPLSRDPIQKRSVSQIPDPATRLPTELSHYHNKRICYPKCLYTPKKKRRKGEIFSEAVTESQRALSEETRRRAKESWLMIRQIKEINWLSEKKRDHKIVFNKVRGLLKR